MNPATILTEADYETARTFAEFDTWWMSIHAAYGATKAGRDFCRAGSGLSKRFYEEAQVMLAFLRAYYRDSNVICRLHAGSGADDAFLENRDSTQKMSIQVTFAADSYNDHWRNVELSRSGSVGLNTKPDIQGSGENRTVEFPESGMVPHSIIVSEMVQSVVKRVAQKNEKRYASPGVLVVGFSDAQLEEVDAEHFQTAHDHIGHSFRELYFIGLHGRISIPKMPNPEHPAAP